jgi:hypothetical protein
MTVASVNRALVRVKPRIFGQQRRMDIEHPPLPFLHKRLAQYPHIAGKRDVGGACVDNTVVHHRVMDGAVEMLMRLGKGRDAFGSGNFEALRVRVVACDEDDFIGAVWMFGSVEQGRHVAAGAGYQDGDFGFHDVPIPKPSC